MSKWIVTAPVGDSDLTYDLEYDNEPEAYETAYRIKGAVYRKVDDQELNENQQAVLSWLIDDYKDYGDPIIAIGDLGDETLPSRWKTCLQAAYENLDTEQKFELLKAFAEWGMKEVAE
ncbi:hypothetical protein [Enterococcus sp. AZ007]|uniref:hypothetical protein n=1 Tax=Enterococcus sp. AZ007 TaxID=2774839 RepID=UPI003F29D458